MRSSIQAGRAERAREPVGLVIAVGDALAAAWRVEPQLSGTGMHAQRPRLIYELNVVPRIGSSAMTWYGSNF